MILAIWPLYNRKAQPLSSSPAAADLVFSHRRKGFGFAFADVPISTSMVGRIVGIPDRGAPCAPALYAVRKSKQYAVLEMKKLNRELRHWEHIYSTVLRISPWATGPRGSSCCGSHLNERNERVTYLLDEYMHLSADFI